MPVIKMPCAIFVEAKRNARLVYECAPLMCALPFANEFSIFHVLCVCVCGSNVHCAFLQIFMAKMFSFN